MEMNFTTQKKPIIEIISRIIIKPFKENKIKFFSVIALGVAVIFTVLFVFWRSNAANKAASEKLAEFYMGYSRNGVPLNTLNEIITRFPKTPAAYHARLIKADLFTEIGRYDEALKILEETLNNGKPDAIKPLAYLRIIYVYDSRKDYPNAIFTSNEFIKKYPDHFLVKDVYLNLAEYYFLYGSKDEAVRVFNEVLVKFPATPEAKRAQSRLDDINKS